MEGINVIPDNVQYWEKLDSKVSLQPDLLYREHDDHEGLGSSWSSTWDLENEKQLTSGFLASRKHQGKVLLIWVTLALHKTVEKDIVTTTS